MSQDHTSCCGDDPEAQLVHRTALEAVRLLHTEPMQRRSTAHVFSGLSRALLQAATDLEGPLDAGQFLTQMRLLEGNASIGLMHSYRPSPNVFKLLALDVPAEGKFVLHFFQDNDAQLSHTRFIRPSPEQEEEVVRQLKAIGHVGVALYGVVWLNQLVAGYEYFTTSEAAPEPLVTPPVENEPDAPAAVVQTLVENALVGTFDHATNVRPLRTPSPQGPTLVRFED